MNEITNNDDNVPYFEESNEELNVIENLNVDSVDNYFVDVSIIEKIKMKINRQNNVDEFN